MNLLLSPWVAAAMAISGMLGLFCLSLWLAFVAWQKSILWTFGVLFVPGVSILFALMHWSTARKPVVFGGIFLGVAFIIFVLRFVAFNMEM